MKKYTNRNIGCMVFIFSIYLGAIASYFIRDAQKTSETAPIHASAPVSQLTTPRPDYSLYSSRFGEPDKIYRDNLYEIVMLRDLDKDGSFDMEERIGPTPGSYSLLVKEGYLERLAIRVVDKIDSPQHSDDPK